MSNYVINFATSLVEELQMEHRTRGLNGFARIFNFRLPTSDFGLLTSNFPSAQPRRCDINNPPTAKLYYSGGELKKLVGR